MVVPLQGACEVTVDGHTHALRGRADVFAGPTDVLYAPEGSELTVTSEAGGRFALSTAAVPAGATPAIRVTRGPRSDQCCATQVTGPPAVQPSKQVTWLRDTSSSEITQRWAPGP